MIDELLGTGAVAERLRVSESCIKKWENAGVLPTALRLMPGSRRVWRAEDIEAARPAVERRMAKGDVLTAA